MINPQPGPPIDAVPLTRGAFVTITTDTGRTIEAMVTMASPNGRSLMLLFDGMIGGWLGMLPAFQADDGSWSALDGRPITITRREADTQ
jgi:hypothetical protein